MNTLKDNDRRGVCTVSQMASKLELSRARFYQLLKSDVFPPPAYCCLTQKPVYPARLQEICIEIRKTGIGFNGQLIRFYRQRKNIKPKPEHKQIAAILREMGLTVTAHQVKKALAQLKVSATSTMTADAELIGRLFKHFYAERQNGV